MSEKERHKILEDIFNAALNKLAENKSADELDLFLAKTCGGDLSLIEEVKEFLVHNKSLTDFSGQIHEKIAKVAKEPSQLFPFQLSHYEIVSEIGRGGMGVVYEAKDKNDGDKVVAIKRGKRLIKEGKTLCRLNHCNLPKVTDFFEEKDEQFLVMEYIEGQNLLEILKEGQCPFPLIDVLKWANQLLDALMYLHAQTPPIIHCDIKPSNLKINGKGEIVLLDFGLVKGKFVSGVAITEESVPGHTPEYAPPEQVNSIDIKPRSDIYSVGATLYHLLTNKLPAKATDRTLKLAQKRPDPLVPVKKINSKIPDFISNLVGEAMALGREERPNAVKLRESLNTFREDMEKVERERLAKLEQERLAKLERGKGAAEGTAQRKIVGPKLKQTPPSATADTLELIAEMERATAQWNLLFGLKEQRGKGKQQNMNMGRNIVGGYCLWPKRGAGETIIPGQIVPTQAKSETWPGEIIDWLLEPRFEIVTKSPYWYNRGSFRPYEKIEYVSLGNIIVSVLSILLGVALLCLWYMGWSLDNFLNEFFKWALRK